MVIEPHHYLGSKLLGLEFENHNIILKGVKSDNVRAQNFRLVILFESVMMIDVMNQYKDLIGIILVLKKLD